VGEGELGGEQCGAVRCAADRRSRRLDGVITAEYATPNIAHVGSKASQRPSVASVTDAIAALLRARLPTRA
jgi:hypothetical protein